METLLKQYKDPADTSSFDRVLEAGKFKASDKGQAVKAYESGTFPKSFFQQLNDNKNNCIATGCNIERIDYYSGWTSIYRGHWDGYQLEHFKGHPQFSSYSCVQLARYNSVYGKQASDMVHKNGLVGRGIPYPRPPSMYTPEFCRDDSVQHRSLCTPYVKKKLIQMYNTDSYIPYGKKDSGKQWTPSFLEMQYVQPFCSNKT